jgi:hypothetical protein
MRAHMGVHGGHVANAAHVIHAAQAAHAADAADAVYGIMWKVEGEGGGGRWKEEGGR